MKRDEFMKEKEKVKKNSYITFVIDESGSMGSVKDATIVGINEQIQQLKKDFNGDEVNVMVSLIKFSATTEPVFMFSAIDGLKEITAADYNPSGSTGMLDAVGFAINQLNARKDISDENTSSLVIVVSDGEENASKEFDSKKIADLVGKANETKRWTFSYLGANQDLSKVSARNRIAIGNTSTFDSNTELGMRSAFTMNASALRSYSKGLMDSTLAYSTTSFYADMDETKKPKATV